MHALVVTHRLAAATPVEYAELAQQLAPAFDAIPGLVSRTPLENRDSGRFGAVYVFLTKAAFDRFVASELYAATYGGPAATGVTASDFSIPDQGGTVR